MYYIGVRADLVTGVLAQQVVFNLPGEYRIVNLWAMSSEDRQGNASDAVLTLNIGTEHTYDSVSVATLNGDNPVTRVGVVAKQGAGTVARTVATADETVFLTIAYERCDAPPPPPRGCGCGCGGRPR